MKLICGNANRPLAKAIAAHMKVPLAECNVRRFADKAVITSPNIRTISIAPMFAKAITRIANGESVSVLFE